MDWAFEQGMAVRRCARARTTTSSIVLLLVLLAGFTLCRYVVTRHSYSLGIDGGLYAAAAVQVRDGHGLLTNVSTHHKGDLTFPAPTSLYPLWPLVLGGLAHLFPLEALGLQLPALLYVVCLVLAYLWGRGLYPRSLLPGIVPGFNTGHVFVLVLGCSALFLSTSEAYTEGLGYALLLASFWRMNTLLPRPSWRGGLEIGIWHALVLLTRPQLVVCALAVWCVLPVAVLVQPGKRLPHLVMLSVFTASFLLAVLPWFLYVWSFAPAASVIDVLRYDSVRSSEVLSRLDAFKHDRSLWQSAADRLSGFKIAFMPGERSYGVYYQTFHYSVVLAGVLGIVGLLRRPLRVALGALEWLRDAENLPRLYAFVYGLGAFLAVHTMHTTSGWYFHRRHGLAAVVFIALTLSYLLLMRSAVARTAGLLILCSGTWLGADRTFTRALNARTKQRPPPSELVDWLRQQQRAKPGLVVAMRSPQKIGYQVPSVGFHWYHPLTRREDVEKMATHLGAEYVLVPDKMRAWWSSRGGSFEHVARKEGHEIYRPRPELLARRPPARQR